MAIDNVTGGSSIDALARQLMSQVDANKDGQLSAQEFGTFLTRMLDGASDPSAVPHNHVSPGLTGSEYQPMSGFDTSKLNDTSHTTMKYTFARAVQDLGLLQAPTSDNLQAIVDRLAEAGVTATVVSKDKIDFGDGYGPIDVIARTGTAEAQWQWLVPELELS